MQRILCATDLTAASRPAVARAASLATATGAELVLVHAFDVGGYVAGVPKGALADVVSEERNGAMLAFDALRSELARRLPRVAGLFVDGYADEAIADTADAQEVDLVVLGARAHGGGGVPDQVAAMIAAPLLLVRGEEVGRFGKVLVGTDFSEPSDRALTVALELAGPDASVELVHHVTMPPLVGGDRHLPTSMLSDLEEASRREGAELLARIDDPRVRFSCDAGSPRDGLLRRAEEGHHDLVALGSHGRRGLRRLLLGSVSAALLRLAPCSVLITR